MSDDRVAQPRTVVGRVGRWCASRPWVVLACWLVVLVGAAVLARQLPANLASGANVVTGSESAWVASTLESSFAGADTEVAFVVVSSPELTTTDPAFAEVTGRTADAARSVAGVTRVRLPSEQPEVLQSASGHTALVALDLSGSVKERLDVARALETAIAPLGTESVTANVTGSSALAVATIDAGNADLARAESVGLPAAAIVLVLAFGSLVAASVPLLLGMLATTGAFGLLTLLTHVTTVDVFVQTATSMVAIAVGIDYSLFIVSRFRFELGDHSGSRPVAHVTRTMDHAGAAVLFSGLTVCVSLLGLWLVRAPKVHSIALGMSAAVLVMVAIATTALPAILCLLGQRINRLALPWARRSLTHPDPTHSVWARWVRFVISRPVLMTLVPVAALALLALPTTRLTYGVDTGAAAVSGSSAGRGMDTLEQSFPAGGIAPVTVVVGRQDGQPLTDADLSDVAAYAGRLAAHPDVARVEDLPRQLDQALGGHGLAEVRAATAASPTDVARVFSPHGDLTTVTVVPRHAPDSTETENLVRDLRTPALAPGGQLQARVGGATATYIDMIDESSRAMPVVIGSVLLVSALLLLFVFRSVALPVKAILMNLLTTGAAFGLTVLVFQEGWLASVVGVDQVGFVQVVLPLFAFALVFGLSMDYEVFMISRMREEWDESHDNDRAIAVGLSHTARVVSAAAAIMVVVFGAFAFTDVLEIKQMGFLLAVAVLIDATIIRLVLVPALMKLMGGWNWWLPGTAPRPGGRPGTGGGRRPAGGRHAAPRRPRTVGGGRHREKVHG